MDIESKVDKVLEELTEIKIQLGEFKAKFSEGDKRMTVIEAHTGSCLLNDHKIREAVFFVADEKKPLEGVVKDWKERQENIKSVKKEGISNLVKYIFQFLIFLLTIAGTGIITFILSHK